MQEFEQERPKLKDVCYPVDHVIRYGKKIRRGICIYLFLPVL